MPNIYFEEKGEELLKRIGMSKSEFARRMGIRKQNVKVLFKSKNLETIHRAAKVMGVPFELLVSYPSEPDPIPMSPHGFSSILQELKALVLENKGLVPDEAAALFYGTDVKTLHRAVSRNSARFPADFLHSSYLFSEAGMYTLAFVLKSPRAIETGIEIIEMSSL